MTRCCKVSGQSYGAVPRVEMRSSRAQVYIDMLKPARRGVPEIWPTRHGVGSISGGPTWHRMQQAGSGPNLFLHNH